MKSSDGTICPTEVAAQLSADLVGEGGFKSLLDWAMAKARLSGNLGKRLLLPPSDTPVVLRLLLQQVEKGTLPFFSLIQNRGRMPPSSAAVEKEAHLEARERSGERKRRRPRRVFQLGRSALRFGVGTPVRGAAKVLSSVLVSPIRRTSRAVAGRRRGRLAGTMSALSLKYCLSFIVLSSLVFFLIFMIQRIRASLRFRILHSTFKGYLWEFSLPALMKFFIK